MNDKHVVVITYNYGTHQDNYHEHFDSLVKALRYTMQAKMEMAEKIYRKAHLDKWKNDIKCPYCNTWWSDDKDLITLKHSFTVHHEWGDSVKCGKCGYISHWNYVAAPVALLCDDKGDIK